MRRVTLMLAAMTLALLLASGVALAVTKIGTNGPDILRGTNGEDNLLGKAGKDVIPGLGGEDNLLGGRGNDAVGGGRGSDNVLGEGGNDYLQDGPFNESSEDNLSGGGGNDVLDAINRPAFGDTIVCGRGFDRVLADRKDVVSDDCEKVAVGVRAAERLFVSIVESGFFEQLHPRFFLVFQ
jgi:Ca2+-binding RTX toxin-like protein